MVKSLPVRNIQRLTTEVELVIFSKLIIDSFSNRINLKEVTQILIILFLRPVELQGRTIILFECQKLPIRSEPCAHRRLEPFGRITLLDIKRLDVCMAVCSCDCVDARLFIAPPEISNVETQLILRHNLLRLVVPANGLAIPAGSEDQRLIRLAPGEVVDALLMSLGEHGYWTLRVAQVPDLKFRNTLVVVGDSHLSGDLRIPGKTHFAIIEGTAILETEDALVDLQVPYHSQPILTCRSKDMLHLPVPCH